MAAVAGLVPCAESGMRIFVRGLPCDSCHARVSRMPVNSPWAPAAGCSVIASMPVISSKQRCSRSIDFENALRQRLGPVGMRLGQPFDAGHKLVHARVVLHGARAQRIHAEIDGVVPCGEAREVANDFDLAQLGELAGRLADALCQEATRIDGRHIERRQFVCALARRRFLKEQRFVLRRVRADLSQCVRTPGLASALFVSDSSVTLTPPPARQPAPWPQRQSFRAASLPSRTRACSCATRDTSG